ncbi:hypothetical protein BDV41DRAFT_13864 [Aspergillus transmontanensis]|uniref:Uncharacterized protein n=1 Tax=Aspergillus transmontanensis TaxID=1034304 RepID=A0A5N6WCH9_9EURO|nr:hypothetical protein BDV41DRAFT_13864 [Aspergillus transmontanensis]
MDTTDFLQFVFNLSYSILFFNFLIYFSFYFMLFLEWSPAKETHRQFPLIILFLFQD